MNSISCVASTEVMISVLSLGDNYFFGSPEDRYAIFRSGKNIFFRVDGEDFPIGLVMAHLIASALDIVWTLYPFHYSSWMFTKKRQYDLPSCIEDAMNNSLAYLEAVDMIDELRQLEAVVYKDADHNFVPSLGANDDNDYTPDFWDLVEEFNIPDPWLPISL